MVDVGLDRMPEYYPIYFAAIDDLGVAEIAVFARQALERTRKTDGWCIYARIYWYASQSVFGDNLFRQSRVNWPDMKKRKAWMTCSADTPTAGTSPIS